MKALAILLACLALASPCAASTYSSAESSNDQGTSGNNNNTITVPPATATGDALVFCFRLESQSVTTLGGTFTTCTGFGTLDTVTSGSIHETCGCRVVQNGDPTSYTPTWTGNSVSRGIMIDVKSTDNTTPVVDTHTITAGQPYGQVTTTVNNDFVILPILTDALNGGVISGGELPMGIGWNQSRAGLLYASQKTAGATTWLPTAVTFSQSPTVTIGDVIAFKANTTTAESFVGVGTSANNTGSATEVIPTFPTNANPGDMQLAGIVENTPGVAITVPLISDIQPRFPTTCASPSSSTYCNNTSGTSTNTVTLPSVNGFAVGDLIVCWSDWNTSTGFTSGPSGFTTQFTDTSRRQFRVYTKVAVSGDIGGTRTVTAAGNVSISFGCQAFYSMSGAAVTFDAAGTFAGAASGTTQTLNAVTAANGNELILPIVVNNTGTTLTFTPTSTVGAAISAANIEPGTSSESILMYAQAASGASATPTVSTSSGIWATVQIALKTNTHVAGPAWTHQAPLATTNEASTVQIDAYSLIIPSGVSTLGIQTSQQFQFASAEATSYGLIEDFSNINTTTPIDASNAIANEGLNQAMEAPLIQPTPNDEFAVSFNGYSGCSPTGTTPGQYPQPIPLVTSNTHLSSYFTTMNAAMASQPVDQCGGPYASITLGLNAATAPTTTNANLRIQQQIEEIFALAPAPVPPTNTGSWFF